MQVRSCTSIAGDIPADAQSETVLLQLGELGPVGDHHQCTHCQAKRFARIIWVQKAVLFSPLVVCSNLPIKVFLFKVILGSLLLIFATSEKNYYCDNEGFPTRLTLRKLMLTTFLEHFFFCQYYVT